MLIDGRTRCHSLPFNCVERLTNIDLLLLALIKKTGRVQARQLNASFILPLSINDCLFCLVDSSIFDILLIVKARLPFKC